MSEAKTFNDFLESQGQVYDKFRATSAEVGVSRGIEKDPGTEPQGAFLVAWRYPDEKSALIQEFSLEISDLVAAIPYGIDNAHTTVSDYGLKPELVINPGDNIDHQEILSNLGLAVRKALDISENSKVSGFGVEFEDTPTNGKSIIATGIPTESIWQLNQQILKQANALGIDLGGSWGTHMTVSRFLEDKPTESRAVAGLMKLIKETPAIGPIKPVAIDVGFFHSSPDGFKFTTSDRFEIAKSNF